MSCQKHLNLKFLSLILHHQLFFTCVYFNYNILAYFPQIKRSKTILMQLLLIERYFLKKTVL